MRGAIGTTVLLALLLLLPGCASMCDSRYDADFHAFGGMRDRIDRTDGRVGSVFDPADAQSAVVPPELTSPPSSPHELPIPDSTGETDSSEESQELRRRLLDQLDRIDQLPTIPNDASPSSSNDAI